MKYSCNFCVSMKSVFVMLSVEELFFSLFVCFCCCWLVSVSFC